MCAIRKAYQKGYTMNKRVIRRGTGLTQELYDKARYGVNKYDDIREALRGWRTTLTTPDACNWRKNNLVIECANKREMTCIQTTVKNTRRSGRGRKSILPPSGYRFITRSEPVEPGKKDGAYRLYIAVEPVEPV